MTRPPVKSTLLGSATNQGGDILHGLIDILSCLPAVGMLGARVAESLA